MADPTIIVGVDCATDPNKVGLALAKVSGAGTLLLDGRLGRSEEPTVECIAGWLRESPRALIALDAPLGWPADLGKALADHRSGMPLLTQPNLLFRRETDRFVKRKIGKQPLDVGADRIARTAHSALRLLQKLRVLTGQEIPLALSPDYSHDVAAIEVYPAATLKAHGIRSSGYKKPGQTEERREIIAGLAERMEVRTRIGPLEHKADVLDAAVCVLAGADFLSGRALSPEDLVTAEWRGGSGCARRFALNHSEDASKDAAHGPYSW